MFVFTNVIEKSNWHFQSMSPLKMTNDKRTICIKTKQYSALFSMSLILFCIINNNGDNRCSLYPFCFHVMSDLWIYKNIKSLPLNSSLVFLNAFLQPFPEVLQQSLSTPMDPLLLLLTPVNRSQLFHSLCIVLKLSCILTVLLPNILSIFLPFNMDMLYFFFYQITLMIVR